MSREPAKCPDHSDAKPVGRMIEFTCGDVIYEAVARRQRRCGLCMEQMFGGPRCYEHNPTPEQREQREKAA